MRLKIMEWNIHQQGRQSIDGEIPLWILKEIPDDIKIVVFTEFNSHALNILEFYGTLAQMGFSYSTTSYSCGWANDILIAVRGEDIKIDAVSYVKAYPDIPNTNLNLDWDTIPENLRTDIHVKGKLIHLWGIRIKDLDGDYQKRANEMETVMRWLKEVAGIRVLIGDFNNLREDTPEESWNLQVLDKKLGDDFERETPSENHSWGVSLHVRDHTFDGYIKNDHVIHSKEIKADVEASYKWDYLAKCNYSLKKPEWNKRELIIPIGEPDHGILFGELIIDEDVKEPLERQTMEAILRKSEEEIKKNGLTGLMTLEELDQYMRKRLADLENGVDPL